MTNVFFDTFINLEKYLEYEQRDPFSNMRDLDGPEQSDWDKYAADEYENLVSEDVNGDNQEMYDLNFFIYKKNVKLFYFYLYFK